MAEQETQASEHPTIQVNVKFLNDTDCKYESDGPAHLFHSATAHSAGIDLRAHLSAAEVIVQPGERVKVGTGVAIEPLAPGVAGFVYSRSGLGAKHGLTVAQGVGVIDPDYRGEIIVWLLNTSKEAKSIMNGERIAQLIFQPFFKADITAVRELGETERGAGGFGHTGKK